jgi:hypothetical protein
MMLRSGILILHGVHMEAEEEVELEILQSRHICRYQEIYGGPGQKSQEYRASVEIRSL